MNLSNNLQAAILIDKQGDSSRIEIKPSTKGALEGAGIGMTIGKCFGPVGIVSGAVIGGTLGAVFGEED